MSVWTWVLIGFCVCGVLLALGSLVPVALAALKLRAKIQELKSRPLVLMLPALQMQSRRFTRIGPQALPLLERAQIALASIPRNVQDERLHEAEDAVEETRRELIELVETLR
jgi:hypothetical protein